MGGTIVDDCESGLSFLVSSNSGARKRGITGRGLSVRASLSPSLPSCGCCCCLFELLISLLENTLSCGFHTCCDKRALLNLSGFTNTGSKMVFLSRDVLPETDSPRTPARKNSDKPT